MSLTQSVQPCIIPDPLDPNYGPSADNIPIVSQSPGAPVTVASINNGSNSIFYNIASSFFPQPTGASYTYRVTFNGYISGATMASAGNVVLIIQVLRANATTYGIASQTVPITNPYSYTAFSLSAVWVPTTGDSIRIILENRSGGTMTNTTLLPTQGSGIELVSKATVQQLIFS